MTWVAPYKDILQSHAEEWKEAKGEERLELKQVVAKEIKDKFKKQATEDKLPSNLADVNIHFALLGRWS